MNTACLFARVRARVCVRARLLMQVREKDGSEAKRFYVPVSSHQTLGRFELRWALRWGRLDDTEPGNKVEVVVVDLALDSLLGVLPW